MNEVQPADMRTVNLIERLGFSVGDQEHAFGDIHGNPVVMTILSADPLALLLAFKIVPPHPDRIALPEAIQSLVEAGAAEVSLENGMAWLSLDTLRGESTDSIQALVEGFAGALSGAGLTPRPGCLSCGFPGEVHHLYAGGRCTRLCSLCTANVLKQRDREERRLTTPGLLHVLALPLAFLYVCVAWWIFWPVVDAHMKPWNIDAGAHPGLEGFLGVGVVMAALGSVVGYPVGLFLRRFGLGRASTPAACFKTVVLAVLVGEFLYVQVGIILHAGVLDLVFAVKEFFRVVGDYPPNWVAAKIVVCGAIGAGCHAALDVNQDVPLRL